MRFAICDLRFAIWAAVAAALAMCVALPVPAARGEQAAAVPGAADAGTADSGPDFIEITPELRAAVRKGFVYLASIQDEDGSFGASRYGRHVGISSLACLAYMADGHLPQRGQYGPNVEKGLKFVLNHAQETGLIAADTSHGPMYGHGFATLFLGELYGMTGDQRIREALVKAVRLIVNTQNAQGGWRYQPLPFDADLSVTICEVMALRSAREAGISVPKKTIDRAISYVQQCQNPADGGFRYMLNSGGSAFPRSAAGVASLYYAGVYEGDALDRGLRYLVTQRERITSQSVGHYFYGHYYAVQAMHMAGGKYWAEWFPSIREELLRNQQDDGSWTSTHGDAYGTAMALIILQVPNRYLPIFQR